MELGNLSKGTLFIRYLFIREGKKEGREERRKEGKKERKRKKNVVCLCGRKQKASCSGL